MKQPSKPHSITVSVTLSIVVGIIACIACLFVQEFIGSLVLGHILSVAPSNMIIFGLLLLTISLLSLFFSSLIAWLLLRLFKVRHSGKRVLLATVFIAIGLLLLYIVPPVFPASTPIPFTSSFELLVATFPLSYLASLYVVNKVENSPRYKKLKRSKLT